MGFAGILAQANTTRRRVPERPPGTSGPGCFTGTSSISCRRSSPGSQLLYFGPLPSRQSAKRTGGGREGLPMPGTKFLRDNEGRANISTLNQRPPKRFEAKSARKRKEWRPAGSHICTRHPESAERTTPTPPPSDVAGILSYRASLLPPPRPHPESGPQNRTTTPPQPPTTATFTSSHEPSHPSFTLSNQEYLSAK